MQLFQIQIRYLSGVGEDQNQTKCGELVGICHHSGNGIQEVCEIQLSQIWGAFRVLTKVGNVVEDVISACRMPDIVFECVVPGEAESIRNFTDEKFIEWIKGKRLGDKNAKWILDIIYQAVSRGYIWGWWAQGWRPSVNAQNLVFTKYKQKCNTF
uniref:Uncharacterized protein n=1 Tax=Schistocephalus solidus TaxID=70667 RepID=A0A0X3PHC9_SCHSO